MAVRWKRVAVLLGCLFVATIGFGITLPVLPFYVERFVPASGAGPRSWLSNATLQVGLITAIYPLVQLLVAPAWGRLSDRLGRRRMLVLGLAGSAISYVLFAFATSLGSLYGARALGGLLSSALLPAATAYVADSTTDDARGRGMAWLGSASSLGTVVGPALGGVLGRVGGGLGAANATLTPREFSVPFLAAAGLALVALLGVLAWLPESARGATGESEPVSQGAPSGLRILLILSLAAQFGLALFETTFALFAKQMWNYGPVEVGAAFTVCGIVMSVAQLATGTRLAARIGAPLQVAVGFGLVGMSFALLVNSAGTTMVLLMVAALALGMSLVGPNVTALISVQHGVRTGSAFGQQTTANGLGQTGGAALGGLLLGWKMDAPFLIAASVFVAVGVWLGWRRNAQTLTRSSAEPQRSRITSTP